MCILKLAFSSAVITGTFLTGAIIGVCINSSKVKDKIKKLTIKKNNAASEKG